MERTPWPIGESLIIEYGSFLQRRWIGFDYSTKHRPLQIDFFDAGKIRLSNQNAEPYP
jgi:hypothetical protein